MTATRKLTRAEACAELARRIGWVPDDTPGSFTYKLWRSPNPTRSYPGNWQECPPDFFTSRDGAAELVAWLAGPSAILLFNHQFNKEVRWLSINAAEGNDITVGALLLTPEQITLAACEALGIEVEDEAR